MKKVFSLFALLLFAAASCFGAYAAFVQFYVDGWQGTALVIFICVVLSVVFGMVLVSAYRILKIPNDDQLRSHHMNQLPGSKRFSPEDVEQAGNNLPPVIELKGQQHRNESPSTTQPSAEGLRAPHPQAKSPEMRSGSTGSSPQEHRGAPQTEMPQQGVSSKSNESDHWTGTSRRVEQVPQTPQRSRKPTVVDTDNVRKLLRKRCEEISELIEVSKKHLSTVDSRMMKNLSKNTSGSIQGVVNVRRIVTALEKRRREIADFLAQPEMGDLATAERLYHGELQIEEDSLTSLLSADPLPPIKPSEWRPTLATLFKRISRRRSIFKGVKFNLHSDQ